MADEASQIMPSSQTHHGGAKGPSKAHLHKPRKAQRHSGRWFWGTQAPVPRHKTHNKESTGALLRPEENITYGYGVHYEKQRKSIWG